MKDQRSVTDTPDKTSLVIMRPTERFRYRARTSVGVVKAAVARIGVGLKDSAISGEMALGMLGRSIARGVEQRRRRRSSSKRPIVANIDPDPTCRRLALGQDRHGRIVTMQPLGGHDMPLDEVVKRAKGMGASTDLVGQRR